MFTSAVGFGEHQPSAVGFGEHQPSAVGFDEHHFLGVDKSVLE
jgi:hypothetical protein